MGKVKAAHALAKIAAVSNPDIAFPGERVGTGAGVGGMGQWEESPLFLGSFLLVALPPAWEGHGAITETAVNWRCLDSRLGSASD